jgi:hypothetical protein
MAAMEPPGGGRPNAEEQFDYARSSAGAAGKRTQHIASGNQVYSNTIAGGADAAPRSSPTRAQALAAMSR